MLREPCEHGRYEAHPFGDDCPMNPGCDCICPGGRSLTDAEALSLLLTDVCDCTVARMVDGVIPTGEQPADPDCPSCGGTGRIPREGVHLSKPDGVWLMVPTSMLKGGE